MEWPHVDTDLFLLINQAHHTFLDGVMTFVSGRFTWIPLYAVLCWFLYQKYGKRIWIPMIFIAFMIVLSDQCANLFKHGVMRLRPCHEAALQPLVHLVNGNCGGSFGFYSSHASNTMAMAVFSLSFIGDYRYMRWFMFVWVLIVGYSRVYLGAHYPLDIITGWFAGLIWGYLIKRASETALKSLTKA